MKHPVSSSFKFPSSMFTKAIACHFAMVHEVYLILDPPTSRDVKFVRDRLIESKVIEVTDLNYVLTINSSIDHTGKVITHAFKIDGNLIDMTFKCSCGNIVIEQDGPCHDPCSSCGKPISDEHENFGMDCNHVERCGDCIIDYYREEPDGMNVIAELIDMKEYNLAKKRCFQINEKL